MAEATQLCNDTAAYFARSISNAVACKWSALTTSASSSSPTDQQLETFCTGQENTCLQADAGAGSNVGAGCLGTIPSSCTATVAQYAACISDETAGFLTTVNGLPSCATVKNTDTTAIFNAQAASSPASCAAISNACSGVFPPDPSQ
jgi:hypothetical protein